MEMKIYAGATLPSSKTTSSIEKESLIFSFTVSYSVLMKRWMVWWTECTTCKETVQICKDHNHNHEFVCLHGNHYEQQRSRNKVGSKLPSLICIRDYEQFSLKKSVFARIFPRVILTWTPAYKGREKASRLQELISTSTWVARYPLAYTRLLSDADIEYRNL